MSTMVFKKCRRFWRRFQYIPPPKRHILLITVCFWLSAITLWSIRHLDTEHYSETADHSSFIFYEHASKDPFNTVIHSAIANWHRNDTKNQPKLLPTQNSPWRSYPDSEVFAWHEPPLHSVRALVDNNKTYLGEMGAPVVIPSHLEAQAQERQSVHQLNVVASELVSLNRRLPDVRHERCRSVRYPKRLPKTSVIVVFHNEAWSTLLRTVHSVINRSPPNLLQEVLLVDDASDHLELGLKLDEYLKTLPVPARVVRMEERGGLIRARLAGAEQATGSVLVFLDAHTEAAPGWLPPILAEIATDRTRVIVPVIDDIMDDTFAYEPVETDYNRGGLDWKLLHAWVESLPFIHGRNPEDAFPTPTMIGCAFAIDREFFYASGAYDSQMMIWGGENVEMSVRIWRCGGSLLAAPCSHVGHVYRKNTPHTVPGGLRAKVDTLNINTARFAEVWLDEPYKRFYYYMNPGARGLELGSLNERLKLKKDLKCHSFQWFLDHVYPDAAFPHRSQYAGQIQHKSSEDCLDAVGSKGEKVGVKMCHGLGGFQTFIFTKNGELKSSINCLMPNNGGKDLVTKSCDFSDEQKWTYKPISDSLGQLIHRHSERCLTFDAKDKKQSKSKKSAMLNFLSNVVKDVVMEMPTPTMEECKEATESQLWSLTNDLSRMYFPGK